MRAVDVRQVEGGAGVAAVEDGGQAHARLQRGYHDAVHFIVDNVAGRSEVDRIDYFIIAIVFVTIKVFRLTAVA